MENIDKKIREYRKRKDYVMVRYFLKVRNWLIEEECYNNKIERGFK